MRVNLKDGDKLWIRFPAGVIAELELKAMLTRMQDDKRKHGSRFMQRRFGVLTEVQGARAWVDIKGVEVQRWQVELVDPLGEET